MRNFSYPDNEGNVAPLGTGYVGHIEISVSAVKLSWLGFDDGRDETNSHHESIIPKSAVLDSQHCTLINNAAVIMSRL